MPPRLLYHMSVMFNKSQAQYLICYHSPKRMIDDYGFDVELIVQTPTFMTGSLQRHTGYIYRHINISQIKTFVAPVSPSKLTFGIPCDQRFAEAWEQSQAGLDDIYEYVSGEVKKGWGEPNKRVTRSVTSTKILGKRIKNNTASTKCVSGAVLRKFRRRNQNPTKKNINGLPIFSGFSSPDDCRACEANDLEDNEKLIMKATHQSVIATAVNETICDAAVTCNQNQETKSEEDHMFFETDSVFDTESEIICGDESLTPFLVEDKNTLFENPVDEDGLNSHITFDNGIEPTEAVDALQPLDEVNYENRNQEEPMRVQINIGKWYQKFKLLKEYKEGNQGSCDVPQDNRVLGVWVKNV